MRGVALPGRPGWYTLLLLLGDLATLNYLLYGAVSLASGDAFTDL